MEIDLGRTLYKPLDISICVVDIHYKKVYYHLKYTGTHTSETFARKLAAILREGGPEKLRRVLHKTMSLYEGNTMPEDPNFPRQKRVNYICTSTDVSIMEPKEKKLNVRAQRIVSGGFVTSLAIDVATGEEKFQFNFDQFNNAF